MLFSVVLFVLNSLTWCGWLLYCIVLYWNHPVCSINGFNQIVVFFFSLCVKLHDILCDYNFCWRTRNNFNLLGKLLKLKLYITKWTPIHSYFWSLPYLFVMKLEFKKKAPLIQLACCIPLLAFCFFLGSPVTRKVLSNLHHRYPNLPLNYQEHCSSPMDSSLVAIYLSCPGRLCHAQ